MDHLSATGYIQVHAYTSFALLPLRDTAVAITDSTGSAIALRLTNSSGQLTEPIAISVPDQSASQNPDSGVQPYTIVDLYAKAPNYEEIEVKGIQVFANVTTDQNLAFIPISELPNAWNQVEIFQTPKQNL